MIPAALQAGARLLVIGGGQGIGKAIADAWPQHATVWTRGNGVDATDPAALRAAFTAFAASHGAPWALIQCAGDFAEQPLLQTDEHAYRHMFASNVDTTFHALQAVVPAMVAARRGRVIVFAAAGVDKERAMTRAPIYFAAKAAVVQMARALAREVAPAGITVNVIAPGLIHHPHSHQQSQQRILPRVPAGRLGTAGDVVSAVRWLLSDEASYVTGQVLGVDGGLHA